MNIFTRLFGGASKKSDTQAIFTPMAQAIFAGKNRNKEQYYYGIVYSCIDAIAQGASSVPYKLIKKDKEGDVLEEVKTHPAIKLLNKPNIFQSGVDLKYLMSSHIDTFGVSYLHVTFNGNNEPAELWALNPACLTPIPGRNGAEFIRGYKYRVNGREITLEPIEVVPIMRPNPFSQLKGISTLEMASLTIEADLNSIDYNSRFFAQGANPGGVMSVPGNLSAEARDSMKRQIKQRYEGKDNAFRIMLLEGGMDYKPIQLSQRDMEFVKQREMSRDEILSIFKVPKPIVAISDDVNRASAEVAEYVFAKRTVKPRIDLTVEKLNAFYLPLFKNTDGLELQYENPVPEDKETQLKYDVAAVNNWETVNEVRDRHGLDPLDGGDELNPLVVQQPTTLSADKNKIEKKREAKSASQVRSFIYRKRRHVNKSTKELALKIKQHIKFLVRDIGNKSIVGKKAKRGVEETLSDLMPDMTEWQGLMYEMTFDASTETLKAGIAITGDAFDMPTSIDLEHSGAIAILQDRAKTTADDATSSLLNRARDIIASKIDEPGYTLSKIKNDLMDALELEADYRSERIARTEMSYAFNSATVLDAQTSGLVSKMKWLQGPTPCDVCEPNVGEVREFGDSFPSGDVQPPVHPNCQCDIIPYFD